MKETGILMFKFKDGITEEEVNEFWMDFYEENESRLEGMRTNLFRDEETYLEFKEMFKIWESKRTINREVCL